MTARGPLPVRFRSMLRRSTKDRTLSPYPTHVSGFLTLDPLPTRVHPWIENQSLAVYAPRDYLRGPDQDKRTGPTTTEIVCQVRRHGVSSITVDQSAVHESVDNRPSSLRVYRNTYPSWSPSPKGIESGFCLAGIRVGVTMGTEGP